MTRVDVPGHGIVEFPDGMSDADITAAIKKNLVKEPPSNLSVTANAANKAIAGIPDTFLNLPTNIWNLGKAAYGSAATALGRPDLAPELSKNPDLVRSGFEKLGLIHQSNEPQ